MNGNRDVESVVGLRYARVLPKGSDYFVHVISRVVERQFHLKEDEKAHFRKLMRTLAEFCGLEVVTYVLMDNHFHLLLRVPEREELDDKEIARRIKLTNGHMASAEFLQEVQRARRQGGKNSTRGR